MFELFFMFSMASRLFFGFFVALVMMSGHAEAQLPDISSVPIDLVVPDVVDAIPSAGKRVRYSTGSWKTTQVHHTIWLPTEWTPPQQTQTRMPIIVEWGGNGGFRNDFGDTCTGLVDDCKLGWGMTGGQRVIWICLPYLDETGSKNQVHWWGNSPDYDPNPTLEYARATIDDTCLRFGGDPARVVLAGFSRGALACNRLGLADDTISPLWRGFVCYSHYDGVVESWPYSSADRVHAHARLEKLAGRPQFICGEGNDADRTRDYLAHTGIRGDFTITGTGFRNHSDAWILRPSPARSLLRQWLSKVLSLEIDP